MLTWVLQHGKTSLSNMNQAYSAVYLTPGDTVLNASENIRYPLSSISLATI